MRGVGAVGSGRSIAIRAAASVGCDRLHIVAWRRAPRRWRMTARAHGVRQGERGRRLHYGNGCAAAALIFGDGELEPRCASSGLRS